MKLPKIRIERAEGAKTKEKKVKKEKTLSNGRLHKEEENRIRMMLKNLTPGTAEYAEVRVELTELIKARKDQIPSADAIVGAATSIGGLGMAVGYDQKNNLSRHASAFVRKPREK